MLPNELRHESDDERDEWSSGGPIAVAAAPEPDHDHCGDPEVDESSDIGGMEQMAGNLDEL
jgi:hypothetical protein